MNSKGKKGWNGRPTMEWAVGAISATLVCAIIGFLGYEALFGETRAPDLVASIDRITKGDRGTLVVVALSNRGDQPAAEITLEAKVRLNRSTHIRKEIRFDYVASQSVRRGAFLVEDRTVEAADVGLQVHGYVEP